MKFVLGVVKEPAVPEVVEASSVVVEEASVRSVELVESIDCVLTGVAVDDIQQDHDATPVRYVNQLLQLVWSPVTTITSQTRNGQRSLVCIRRATERHLPHGIASCYLPLDTGERAPPSSKPDKLVLDLPSPEG